jgi:hypothetical protein
LERLVVRATSTGQTAFVHGSFWDVDCAGPDRHLAGSDTMYRAYPDIHASGLAVQGDTITTR